MMKILTCHHSCLSGRDGAEETRVAVLNTNVSSGQFEKEED